VNHVSAGTLRRSFQVVDNRQAADLVVASFDWKQPQAPRRLFIDHGSFADASFWTFTVPGLRSSDTILVASRVCERVAARCIEAAGARILRVPFFVDTDRFRPVPDRLGARRQLADERAVPAEGALLLAASAFVRRKNLHLAVHFLHALLEFVPEARLVIVGGTPERPSNLGYRHAIERLAATLGVDKRVHLLGALPQGELARLMAAADLLVHFSNARMENFGLVVAESLASGLPVIAADWGGLRDLVRHGENGFLAPTYLSDNGPRTDWRAPLPVVADALRDPAIWSDLSRRARGVAEASLRVAAFSERLREAVSEALGGVVGEGQPPVLSPGATEMMFRTLNLYSRSGGPIGTGNEFRRLMTLDEGRHYRFLCGPIASSESPPGLGGGELLYPVVTWGEGAAGIRITDPAWPGSVVATSLHLDLLRRVGAGTDLGTLLVCTSAAGIPRAEGLRYAQDLVDWGLLCPLGTTRIMEVDDP